MVKAHILVFLLAALLAVGCDKKDKGTTLNDGGNGNGTGGQISLDHVDGLYGPNSVQTGVLITFYIRFRNNTGDTLTGSTNGFRVYSPDNAQWQPITWDPVYPGLDTLYDLGVFFRPFGIDGSGADTIGFGGASLSDTTGIPDGFDEVVLSISTQVNQQYENRRLCLDSAFFPPGGEWLWVKKTGNTSVTPSWDGPHCFRIVNPP
jgi:hypothetical protein